MPTVSYPENLPVAERRDDILEAIREHQVVVIAGETGSGKTTQIPKMCLELGRGIQGRIGHTQPRRIAARAVAERIADELDVELGQAVGYQVRFTDHTSDSTLVKVMTDGVLLTEMRHDRDLRRYDTIIIDEAHERSLNIDFILGYLKQLLPRRPDLKVIVTSATIDPEKFATHFADAQGNPAPIIEVSGRTYPVEMRYRPLIDPDDPQAEEKDQTTGICEAVLELWTEGGGSALKGYGQGDILVFCSGEREIRDATDALTGMKLPDTEIIPLFARLSAAEQHKVFSPHRGRRIVVSTNVAETSLTVPGIRYVVDTGTARISRYSRSTKVQRLPIEPVSQASANQRSGRCGRVEAGICIRLYSEADFESRPEFTDPEIVRTNLASVILQMTTLGLGDIARFPFVDPPDPRQITDGVRLLEELHCFDAEEDTAGRGRPRGGRRLTAYGRTIAQLPVDPRLARMVIEADKRGVLPEVLVIVSALSIQDPRERPQEKKELANAAHKRFADEHSDFIAYLNLWEHLRQQQKELSSSAFRRMCKAEFLHYLRVREWQDLHTQLRRAAKDAGLDVTRGSHAESSTRDTDAIHQSLLSGLLSHVGVRDEARRDYLGARGTHFAVSPGSALFRKQPQFVMAEELVETSKLWARVVGRIDPLWAEELGAHLVKRQHSEPRWSGKRGSAVATERVTLYGVPLVTGRVVGLGRIDPPLARELFIRHALVEGDWVSRHRFLKENQELVARLSELEERTRQRGLVVGEDALFAFYDKRVGESVVSGRHFDSWWRKVSKGTPDLLTFTEEMLLREGDGPAVEEFPTTWVSNGHELSLTYRFEPGAPDDGVTVHIPVGVLNQVDADGFDWLVPGLREDLVAALIKALPKGIRKFVVPAPDHARAVLPLLEQTRSDGSGTNALVDELARVLQPRAGVPVSPSDFDLTRVPDHLRVTFSVDRPDGSVVASGKDLDALQEKASPALRRSVSKAAAGIERTGLTTWSIGELPQTYEARGVRGYPALVDEGQSVALRVLPTAEEARSESRLGVRRLLLLAVNPPWKQVLARLSNAQKLALGHNPHGSVPALLDDCLSCAVDDIRARAVDHEVRSEADFAAALAGVRTHLTARVVQVVSAVEPVLASHLRITNALARMTSPALAPLVADVRAQTRELIRPGFVAETGFSRLADLERYLRAVEVRLDKAPEDLRRDAQRLADVDLVETRYAELLERLRPTQRASDPVVEIAWMIEELRVSLFAQSVGTKGKVSVQRILKAIAAVQA